LDDTASNENKAARRAYGKHIENGTTNSSRNGNVLRAGSPGNADLLCELEGSIVIGDFTGAIVTVGCQGNAVVDIENAVGSAWRPDNGLSSDAVALGVGLAGSVLRATENSVGSSLDRLVVFL
jgi:hypothetical protein